MDTDNRDAAPSLDAAWSEAEATLPEGWVIGGLQLEADDDPSVADDWHAWAGAVASHCPTCDCGPKSAGRGPTPAAAVRSLAETLRARK